MNTKLKTMKISRIASAFFIVLATGGWPECGGSANRDMAAHVVYGCAQALSDTFAANEVCFQTPNTGSCKFDAAMAAYNKIQTRYGRDAFLNSIGCMCAACTPADGPTVCIYNLFPDNVTHAIDVYHTQCVSVSFWNGCASIIQNDCYGDGGTWPSSVDVLGDFPIPEEG